MGEGLTGELVQGRGLMGLREREEPGKGKSFGMQEKNIEKF